MTGRLRRPFAAVSRLFRALALLVVAASLPGVAHALTINWNNAAGGDWSTGINWVGGVPPGPGDVARIALNGTYTVTLGAGVTVAGLQLAGTSGTQTLGITSATLTINGPATVSAAGQILLTGATLGGSGTLTLDGTLDARGTSAVNLALTPNAGATLRVTGTGAASALTVAAGFTAAGTVELTNAAANAGATLNVTSGTLTVGAGGQLKSLAGAGGGTRTLGAVLNNQGTLTVSHPLSLARAGADHLNSGTINVSGGDLSVTQTGTTPSFSTSGPISIGAGRVLSVTGGTFTQTAGTLSGATGTLALSSLTATFGQALNTLNLGLDFTNCTLGGPSLTNGAGATLTLSGDILNLPLTNSGTLILNGSNSCPGGLVSSAGSTLRVEGGTAGPAALTVTGNLVNNGTLQLTSAGAAQDATLNLIAGALTNAAGRTIDAQAGAGGNRYIGARLDNQGTLTVNAPLTLTASAVAHQNSGTINVSGADLLVSQTGGSPSFTTSGTITLGAGHALSVLGGAFTQSGGTISGATGTLFLNGVAVNLVPGFTVGTCFLSLLGSTLSGGTLTIPATKTLTLRDDTIQAAVNNSGTLVINGACALDGSVQQNAGAALKVEGSGVGAATLTVATGFTNNGTIDLTNGSLGQNATLNVTSGTLTNAAGATLKSSTGSTGGTRTLNAVLNNQGTFTVGTTLAVTRNDAAHQNSGTITLSGGDLAFNQGGAAPGLTSTGTISIPFTRTLTVTAGALTVGSGGVLEGRGTLTATGTTFHVAGVVRPGDSGGTGNLLVNGNVTMDPTATLEIQMGGTVQGSTLDRFTVSGNLALGGTLALALVNGYVPGTAALHGVVACGSHSGDFATVTGLEPLPGVTLLFSPPGPSYGANAITVLRQSQAWAALNAAGAPTPRSGAGLAYVPATSRLVLFGGLTDGGPSNALLVALDPNPGGSPTWIAVTTTGPAPTPRQGAAVAYSTSTDRLVIFGGDDGQASPTLRATVVVVENPDGAQPAGAANWHAALLPGGSGPGARSLMASGYNTSTDRLVVMGGRTGAGCSVANDVYVLTNATSISGGQAWVALSPTGTPPAPRARAAATYDPATNRLIVYGGDDLCGTTFSDAFVLDGADGTAGTPHWSPLTLSNTPLPAVTGGGGAYDAGYDRFAGFGGLRGAAGTPDDGTTMIFGALAQTPDARWTLLPDAPRPPARWGHATAYDAVNHRLFIFGGDAGTTTPARLNDTWILVVNKEDAAVTAVEDPPTPGITAAGFLRAPTPNPTLGGLRFTLGLPEPGRAGVALFDVRGRRVRALFEGPLPAGAHEFAWDGRDDTGARAAAGVYFLRAELPGGTSVRRVTLAR